MAHLAYGRMALQKVTDMTNVDLAATAALVVTTTTGSDTLPASDEVEHQIAGAEQAAAM